MGRSWADQFNETMLVVSKLNPRCRNVYKVFKSESPIRTLSLDGTKVATLVSLFFPAALDMYSYFPTFFSV